MIYDKNVIPELICDGIKKLTPSNVPRVSYNMKVTKM